MSKHYYARESGRKHYMLHEDEALEVTPEVAVVKTAGDMIVASVAVEVVAGVVIEVVVGAEVEIVAKAFFCLLS